MMGMINKRLDQLSQDKPLQDKCGIVALLGKTYSNSLPLALLAAGGVQHRGQQGAGIALCTKRGVKYHTGNGLLKDIFTSQVVDTLDRPCRWVMVHCRYGTNGGYDKRNLQPCAVKSKEGIPISVVHNGEFVATEKLRSLLLKKFPDDISDTYLFAQLLAETEGVNWDKRVIDALSRVRGAYSLIIGIEERIYIARDEQGIRPLIVGRQNGTWIVASETHALDKIGAKVTREVKRGEIIRIDSAGITVIKRGIEGKGNFCDFEWAYFSRPDSLLSTGQREHEGRAPQSWLSILAFRERCGATIANENPLPSADFVVGLPDSGLGVAMGYASAMKLPYRQAVIRDHFDPSGNQRLFMRDDQKKKMQKRVLGKLSLVADPRIWKNAKVVVGDDSIVRSNVATRMTKAILAAGAREVHWILGFPPVTHPCHLGVSIRSRDELIAAKYNADSAKIAKKIGATSVYYISHKGFVRARAQSHLIQIPSDLQDIFLVNGGCGGCLTGRYPVNKDGTITKYSK